MIKLRLAPLCLLLAFCLAAPSAVALGLNDLRAASHRAPLRVDRTLAAVAARHAADLARRNHLDHDGFVSERVRVGARAENVSFGCPDRDCAIRQWNRSAPHRANMLRADVRAYGLASARSASGPRYWVLELGDSPEKVRPRETALVRSAGRGAPAGTRCVLGSDGCLRVRP